jgi:predicted regulator of Ras-like GTPase activity (Roadblock/LC7/MglB family)
VGQRLHNSGSTKITELINTMTEQGNFSITVLADRQGLPIAWSARTGQNPETQAAVVALVQKTATQVRQQLDMAQIDEVSLYDIKGQRLVCRPFKANEHDLILAVLVSDKNQTYRQLTNKTIYAIQRWWQL